MFNIAARYADKGYMLRSGAAPGADSAFEAGCDSANGLKEIFLPWKDFNGHSSQLYTPHPLAFEVIDDWWPGNTTYHAARKLWARNFQQILGNDLMNPDPVDFVICWTPNGMMKGGTAKAIVVAKHFDIPVFNLFHGTRDLDLFDW